VNDWPAQDKTVHKLTIPRALKAHFAALEETSDVPGVNEARGYACEFVAWQFITNLSEREAIDYLLLELPSPLSASRVASNEGISNGDAQPEGREDTPLLHSSQNGHTSYFGTDSIHAGVSAPSAQTDEFAAKFENLSALEIAIVSGSKKFLSQRAVQKLINGIWRAWPPILFIDVYLTVAGRYHFLGVHERQLCQTSKALQP
jgi:hypothetical protein